MDVRWGSGMRLLARDRIGAGVRDTGFGVVAGPERCRAYQELRRLVPDGVRSPLLSSFGPTTGLGAPQHWRSMSPERRTFDKQRGPRPQSCRRSRHWRDPLEPSHRTWQGLLAQPTTRPRPMAGVPGDRLITGVTHDATHVPPMSRLKTLARPEGFEPP